MSTLIIDRTYANGELLVESDLDQIKDDVETFFNVTKLSGVNFPANSITASSKITAGTITNGKVANGAVTTAKITDGGIEASSFAAEVAADGLSTDTDGALVPVVDDSTLEISAGLIRVKDDGITTAKLADAAVTTSKVSGGNATIKGRESAVYVAPNNGQMASDAVTTAPTINRPYLVFFSAVVDPGNPPTHPQSIHSLGVTDPVVRTRFLLTNAANTTTYAYFRTDISGQSDAFVDDRQCLNFWPFPLLKVFQGTAMTPGNRIYAEQSSGIGEVGLTNTSLNVLAWNP